MTKTVQQIVSVALATAPRQYLEEVVAHGIHNLSNAYQGKTDEEYEEYRAEFEEQAQALLDVME